MWNTTNDRQAFSHIHSSPPTDAFSPSSSPPSSRLSSGSHIVLFFFVCIMIYCIKWFLKISTLTNKKFIFVYEIADFFIEIFSFKLCWILSLNSYWLLVSNLCLSKNLHDCCKVFPDITTIVGAERIFILLESCPAWNDRLQKFARGPEISYQNYLFLHLSLYLWFLSQEQDSCALRWNSMDYIRVSWAIKLIHYFHPSI